MEKITLFELMEEIILKMSSKVNKKALKEVIADFDYMFGDDLNYILMNYYNRIHRQNNDYFYDIHYLEDFDDETEFNTFIKNAYDMKIYKNKYDYENGGKITQKHTGLVLGFNNGFIVWGQWVFDVYKYMDVKGLTEDDITDLYY